MQETFRQVYEYFDKLELHKDVATLYVTLITYGPQTISELSRNSRIERTKVYRLLDDLRDAHLIETEATTSRHMFTAAPVSNIRTLIAKREQSIKSLYEDLATVEASLVPTSLVSPGTKVQFYRGIEMVKQMLWNETKSRTEVLAILQEHVQGRTNATFYNRWVEASNERGIRQRAIVGDIFLRSQQRLGVRGQLQDSEVHYVSPEYFPVNHSVAVYDDVVAHYHWQGEEVFGIEMRDPIIAAMQRQFFDILWHTSAPLDEGMAWELDGQEA